MLSRASIFMSDTLVRPETKVCIDYVETKSNGLHLQNIYIGQVSIISLNLPINVSNERNCFQKYFLSFAKTAT